MEDYRYSILMDGEPIATDMTIDNALILAEALCNRHNRGELSITIHRYAKIRCSTERSL